MTLLICGIFKNGVNEVIFKTVTSAKNNLAATSGESPGGINQEIGIDRKWLLGTYCIAQRSLLNILITHIGTESKRVVVL